MRAQPIVIIGLLVVLFLASNSAFAINVDIIESQSYSASHVMDLNWATVATGMGHTATIYPQTALDTGFFLPTSDLLIISSGVISLTPIRKLTILAAMAQTIPVYIQTEADPALDASSAWIDLVNDSFASFTWDGSSFGVLTPMHVSGHSSTTPNIVTQLNGFLDGAHGTGSIELETFLHHGDKEYGWYLRPWNGAIQIAATTSDQEWVRTLSNPSLMENIIDNLSNYNSTNLQTRCWHNGPPIVIPNGGGTITAFTQATNNGPYSITFDAWTQIQLPNTNIVGPFLFYPNLTMGPFGNSIPYTFNQYIPGWAPPGTYYLHTGVGTFGTPWLNIDSIEFTKLVVGADGADTVDDWSATGSLGPEIASAEEDMVVPSSFVLGDPYPNPFNPSTSVNVSMSEAAPLRLIVYDVQGREVAVLADGMQLAGSHSFSFEARDLASGVYFLRADSPGNVSETRKLVLMR
jgi:Secretion system C-terminal sorting domain